MCFFDVEEDELKHHSTFLCVKKDLWFLWLLYWKIKCTFVGSLWLVDITYIYYGIKWIYDY